MLSSLKRRLRGVLARFRPARDPNELASEAADYWSNTDSDEVQVNAHWDGVGPFAEPGRWEHLGQRNLALFDRMTGNTDAARPLGVVVEWGCGGGANIIAFGPRAELYYGVDVADETLDRAAHNAATAGVDRFTGVKVDIPSPSTALAQIDRPVDLFLCTYVLELVPNRAYGVDVMMIAHRMLKSGGSAFVQIRYDPTGAGYDRNRGRYREAVASMTAYGIDEFWQLAAELGFTPELIHLTPVDEVVNDHNYAYFLLTKTGESPAG